EGITAIGNEAFYDCRYVTEIELPDTLDSIGSDVFNYCISLKNIVLPEGLTTIGESAFSWCKKLESITIPESVTFINWYTFHDCESLKTVYYTGTQEQWDAMKISSYGNEYFINAEVVFIEKEYTITFETGIPSLKVDPVKVKAGETLGELPNLRFDGYILTSWWDNDDFDGWPWTAELDRVNSDITLYANWKRLNTTGAEDLIPDKENYLSITLNQTEGGTLVADMDGAAWGEVVKLTAVPDRGYEVAGILYKFHYTGEAFVPGDTAFVVVGGTMEARAIFNRVADDSLVFGTCGENAEWTLDKDTGVLTISGSGDMNNYTEEYDEETYEDYITAPWFDYADIITEVVVEKGVTSIGDYAFSHLENIEKVELPDGLKTIGGKAFSFCENLKEIIIPDTVTDIGDSAFMYCQALNTINIPEGVAAIKNYTFYSCRSLESVTVTDSLTSVRINAFGGCDRLEKVYYNGTQEQWRNIEVGKNNRKFALATVVLEDGTTFKGEGPESSGTCGDNLLWTLDGSGTLTISGTGAMYDFGYNE
ncbi:MAG: leucine-rich repeat protein, partial [Oscillospiraceae bacterium]|nr:leucine-rich repeat protein [Oscillospiraceae bacterium]